MWIMSDRSILQLATHGPTGKIRSLRYKLTISRTLRYINRKYARKFCPHIASYRKFHSEPMKYKSNVKEGEDIKGKINKKKYAIRQSSNPSSPKGSKTATGEKKREHHVRKIEM